MKDYSGIGLTSNLISKTSLGSKDTFVSSMEMDSDYDAAAVTIDKVNKSSVFKISPLTTLGTFSAASGVQLTVRNLKTILNRREIRPMVLMADLYVDARSDNNLFNGFLYGTALTDEQRQVRFWSSTGNRENELDRNAIATTYQITNIGTATHSYILDDRLVYVPIK